MTDTTAARRALLNLLLDRVDRDALLEPEKPLLRCLVAAEQGAADALDRPTTPDDDARPWIADAFGLDIESSWGVIADAARSHLHHLAAANDAIARVRELAERWAYVPGLKGSPRTSLLRALDGPSPTPDDTPTTRCGCGLISCERAAALATTPPTPDDASDVEIVAANDIPTDWARGTEPRCPARYTGPPPGIDPQWGARSDYRCDLRLHARGTDHAVQLGSGPFAWTDDIAVWPTPVPPALMPDDSRPCPTQFTDADCAGTWQHPGDCTTNADDIPSTQETNAPPPQCPAQYTGYPDRHNHCQLRQGHVGDHIENIDPTLAVRWPESTAVYPVDDAPSEPQP